MADKEAKVTVEKKPTKVRYMIPISPDPQAEDTVFVSVNGKNYRIKRGVEVTLPVAVVEVLENSFRENNRAYRIAKQKQEEFLKELQNVKFV